MSDLINRAAAIEALDGAKVDEEYCTEYDIGYNDGIDFAVSRLSVLPSAQPEIIRCKDCKKYDMHDHRCKHWNHGVVVMDWCNKAERR